MKRQLETAPVGKRKRRKWTIEEKLIMLDGLRDGMRPCELSRKYDINESTLRQIHANEKQLREYAAQCTDVSLQSSSHMPRNSMLGRTENMVYQWYESEKAERLAAGRCFTIGEICAKAREFNAELEAKAVANGDLTADDLERREFKASKTWFAKFHKYYKLDYKLTQEDAIDSDDIAKQITEVIVAGGYGPQQVFSAAELLLTWRRVPIAPIKTATNERERLSLLLCANACGDFVVKPLLVHRTLTPYSLRNLKLEDLPVFWRARDRETQRCPRVTAQLLIEWLRECFTPCVRDFLTIMELPERCVLLFDNKLLPPAMMQEVETAMHGDAFVHIEFVKRHQHPISGTNVLVLFKCVYLKRLLAHLMQTAEQESLLFAKVWRNFSIGAAVDVITETLDEFKAEYWNHGWAHLWPGVVENRLPNRAVTEELQRVTIVANVVPMAGYDCLSVADLRKHFRLSGAADDDDSAAQDYETAALQALGLYDSGSGNHDDDDDADVDAGYGDGGDVGAVDADEALPQLETVMVANDSRRFNDGAATQHNQVRSINKVLQLSRDLMAAMRLVDIEGKERLAEQLQALVQPYKELKERTLQPTIRQFFYTARQEEA